MTNELKKRILDYLVKHDDGSDDAKKFITDMSNQIKYADCDVYSVCPEDLEKALNEEQKDKLRSHLGKQKGEPFSIDDCESIADSLADYVAEDFGANLQCTISLIVDYL